MYAPRQEGYPAKKEESSDDDDSNGGGHALGERAGGGAGCRYIGEDFRVMLHLLVQIKTWNIHKHHKGLLVMPCGLIVRLAHSKGLLVRGEALELVRLACKACSLLSNLRITSFLSTP